MRVQIITSDQVENTAVIGGNEKALCVPISHACVDDLNARGHDARFYDPAKTYTIPKFTDWMPDVVVFIHVNAANTTGRMRFMAVDCSHARNYDWSKALVLNTLANMPDAPFSAGDVATDYQLRNFCYWFYRRLRGYDSHGKMTYPVYAGLRTVLEMGNMKCPEQAGYLYENPDVVGKAISRAIAPESIIPEPVEDEEMTAEEKALLEHSDKAASQNTYDIRIANRIAIGDYQSAVDMSEAFYSRWPDDYGSLPKGITVDELKARVEAS